MRAPPLARMAEVAAPRPDAEPVTIAHKPSFDIRFPFVVLSRTISRWHTISRGEIPANPRSPRCGIRTSPGETSCRHRKRPCGQRLSRLWLFRIIKRKKKTKEQGTKQRERRGGE